jgi:hypothetical protein
MGIQTGETPESRSASPVPPEDPSPAEIQNLPADLQQGSDCLLSFELDELLRLLDVYEEEIESVYPFTNIKEFSLRLPCILNYVRNCGNSPSDEPPRTEPQTSQIELKDVQLVKLAIATAIIIEARGSNALSKKLVDSVESVVCRVSGEAKIDLKEVQIMTMLVSSCRRNDRVSTDADPEIEHFLVPCRRRTSGLAGDWHFWPRGPGDWIAQARHTFGEFPGSQGPRYGCADILVCLRPRPTLEFWHKSVFCPHRQRY